MVVGNYDGFNKKSFLKGKNLCSGKWYNGNWIAQDSTFWTRTLWKKHNGLNNGYNFAADFLLWTEFYQSAELYGVDSSLAGYRFHEKQKTTQQGVYDAQAEEIFFSNGGKPYSPIESFVREKMLLPAVKSAVLMKCLRKIGLLNPAKTFRCLNRQGRWELFVDHIV